MTTEFEIERALRQGFLAALGDIEGSVRNITAFENEAFDPTGKAKWYGITFHPNDPNVATLGRIGQDNFTGFLQIDINIPSGDGHGTSDFDISLLRSYFYAGARLSYGTTKVTVTNCGRSGQGFNVDQFFRIPVCVYFYSRIARREGGIVTLGSGEPVTLGDGELVTY